jgi:hypothetical protein
MGVRVIDGTRGECNKYAVIFCSTSMTAFGPVMYDADEAYAFLKWLRKDPRLMSEDELAGQHLKFKCQYRRDEDG